jgi:hypothetical protein
MAMVHDVRMEHVAAIRGKPVVAKDLIKNNISSLVLDAADIRGMDNPNMRCKNLRAVANAGKLGPGDFERCKDKFAKLSTGQEAEFNTRKMPLPNLVEALIDLQCPPYFAWFVASALDAPNRLSHKAKAEASAKVKAVAKGGVRAAAKVKADLDMALASYSVKGHLDFLEFTILFSAMWRWDSVAKLGFVYRTMAAGKDCVTRDQMAEIGTNAVRIQKVSGGRRVMESTESLQKDESFKKLMQSYDMCDENKDRVLTLDEVKWGFETHQTVRDIWLRFMGDIS